MKTIILSVLLCCLIPTWLLAELPLGKQPPKVVLSKPEGGKVKDGSPWDTSKLTGRVNVIFYVDPDERTLNDAAVEALRNDTTIDSKNDNFSTNVVINMDATWLPNAFVGGLIEDSQEENPDTVYVFDYIEKLHKEWGIATDSYDIIVLDKEGKVVFSKDGELSSNDIQAMLKAIHDNL